MDIHRVGASDYRVCKELPLYHVLTREDIFPLDPSGVPQAGEISCRDEVGLLKSRHVFNKEAADPPYLTPGLHLRPAPLSRIQRIDPNSAHIGVDRSGWEGACQQVIDIKAPFFDPLLCQTLPLRLADLLIPRYVHTGHFVHQGPGLKDSFFVPYLPAAAGTDRHAPMEGGVNDHFAAHSLDPLLVVDGQCGDDAVLYLRADDPGMEEQLHARLVHQIEDQIFEYLGLIGDDWDIQVSASA